MLQPYSMPISDLLYKYYNQLKRNKDGTIIYDKQFKEVTENLLNLECLDSSLYSTYDAFFHAVTNGSVLYDKQQKASENADMIKPVEPEDILSMVRNVNERLYNTSTSDRMTYRIPEGSKSKYKYVNDVLTDEMEARRTDIHFGWYRKRKKYFYQKRAVKKLRQSKSYYL